MKSQWPTVVGPVVSQTQAQAHVQARAQAHLAYPIVKTHLGVVYTSDTNGLNESMVCDKGMSGLGGTSTVLGVAAMEPMVVPEAPVVVSEASTVAPEALTVVSEDPVRVESISCPILEVLAPVSVDSHSDRVAVRQIGEDRRHKVDLPVLGSSKEWRWVHT